ncbi:MAG: flagellar biosynthetic protein FliO [Deltaproteobacteria bacterium]|nr:flagellar biosynthetic protein FliO [Deltaproteobacteria bacterium]
MTEAVLKMILVLGIILLALFFLARLLKKNRMMAGGASNDSAIRVLATQCLAPQKYLSLVEIGGEVLALGISEAHISLLTKIENREFIEKMLNRTAHKQEASFPLQYFPPFFTKPKGLKNGLWRRVYGK